MRFYLLAWVPLAAIYAALFTASGRPPFTAARGAVVSVVPFLLLGLLALRVPQRLPWRDERRGSFILAQLGLLALYGVVGSLGVNGLWYVDAVLTDAPVRFQPINVLLQSVLGGLMYLAIAGGAYAWAGAQRLRNAETLRARAELAALRSQVNPHFLLNTLHAALGLVRRDPALAERALERLGEVLHYGLKMHRESRDWVTLADEWAFVKSYLEIEGLRLEERLRLTLDADAAAMQQRVPPFVLQPLVENAIVHAVAPRKAGGRVEITARVVGTKLELQVSDDGPGLPAAPAAGSGLGLKLVRERLLLLYGGEASLSLQPAGASGLRATLALPLLGELS